MDIRRLDDYFAFFRRMDSIFALADQSHDFDLDPPDIIQGGPEPPCILFIPGD